MTIDIDRIFRPLYHSALASAVISADYKIIRANPVLTALLDYKEADLLDMALKDLTPKGQRARHSAQLEQLLAGQINSFELRIDLITAGQQQVNTELSVVAIEDDQQQCIAALMQVVDVTQDVMRELELKKMFQAVESSGSAVVITDNKGIIEYANSRFTDITGYLNEEIIGQTPALLRSEATQQHTYQELWNHLNSGQKWRGSLYNRRKNGTHYWALQSISPIHDEQGQLVNIVSVSEDITAMKDHERQMEQLAYFDPLTQLGNRRNFREKLEQTIRLQTDKYQALLLLDLDGFKQINDTLGHEAGDNLLTTIANRLRFAVEAPSTVFRLGGDEFTVILRNLPNTNALEQKAGEISRLLSQPLSLGSREIKITVSIGITLIGIDSADSSSLLRNADLAMYQAKDNGRNNFQFFNPAMNIAARQAMTLELDLRMALEQEQFYLMYQPQVSLTDGSITGIEALIRWRHPTDGIVPPNEFIGKAEETGLIIPVGQWVLNEACKAASEIQRLGLPGIKVAVNLSAKQFNDQLFDTVKQALSDNKLEPQYLELEITEGVLMDNFQQAADILQQLQDYGITLAIDDFGTGYSSLSYLKRMPVDILKIDRSFVQEIPHNKDDMAITNTIISMANQLSLSVIAEGIETEQQLNFLQQQQCVIGQGYLFSPPVPLDQFITAYRLDQTHKDSFSPLFT